MHFVVIEVGFFPEAPYGFTFLRETMRANFIYYKKRVIDFIARNFPFWRLKII